MATQKKMDDVSREMEKEHQRQRELGSTLLLERFPQARALWSHTFSNRDGFPQAFSITAYNINGRVVILQEFAEMGNSWDVYVQASDSGRIDETLDAVAVRCGVVVRCPDCLDVAGKDGLGRVCAKCNGAGTLIR